MEFDRVEWQGENTPTVYIKPSVEHGFFMHQRDQHIIGPAVGRSAVLFEVDVDDAHALENDDFAVLDKYASLDDQEPPKIQFRDCQPALQIGQNLVPFEDGLLELQPYPAKK